MKYFKKYQSDPTVVVSLIPIDYRLSADRDRKQRASELLQNHTRTSLRCTMQDNHGCICKRGKPIIVTVVAIVENANAL
jgi:hypothetical protein